MVSKVLSRCGRRPVLTVLHCKIDADTSLSLCPSAFSHFLLWTNMFRISTLCIMASPSNMLLSGPKATAESEERAQALSRAKEMEAVDDASKEQQ